jgi:hypothetical protein
MERGTFGLGLEGAPARLEEDGIDLGAQRGLQIAPSDRNDGRTSWHRGALPPCSGRSQRARAGGRAYPMPHFAAQ